MADVYSYAYATDPIANGFVLMSTTLNGFPALSNQMTVPSLFRVAETACCGSNTTDWRSVSDCMLTKPADILAAFGPEDTGLGAVPTFGPVADDIIVFGDFNQRRSTEAGYLIDNT